MSDLKRKLDALPSSPGVYIMKDSKDGVLYVGKAKDLKTRVSNYFTKGRDSRNSVLLFVPKIKDLEFIITDNEKEAFLLENNLIKKLKPHYNISLKDDKDFLSIRIDMKEDFPRLTFVRRPKEDGALYFGPYASGGSIKEAIRTVGKVFPLRRCSDHVFRNRSRPCILHQIELCMAPCVGSITREKYSEIVEGAIDFLKGNTKKVLMDLKAHMNRASIEMKYEKAAKLRDKIKAIDESMLEQKVIDLDFLNRDVFGFARNKDNVVVSLLSYRAGKLSGGKNFKLKSRYLSDAEAFSSFLSQYYLNKASYIPEEIISPPIIEDRELLEDGILKKRSARTLIRVPQKGELLRLVKMAHENAKKALDEISSSAVKAEKLLKLAEIKLKLTKTPKRIEGYDISNIQGKDATGSMVVFSGGVSDKGAYRRFKIRIAGEADDYGMMREVLERRLSNDDLGSLPDLIVIDGGKGHLNVAADALKEKSYEHIDVISIAKERIKGKERSFDRVFVRGRKNPLNLKARSPVLHLIQNVRDEAHRFAVSYHKLLRNPLKKQ